MNKMNDDVSLGGEDQSEKLIPSNGDEENNAQNKFDAQDMEPKEEELLSNEESPQDTVDIDSNGETAQAVVNGASPKVNAENPDIPQNEEELSSTGEFSPDRKDKSSSLTSVTDTESLEMAENEVQDAEVCQEDSGRGDDDGSVDESESLVAKETQDVDQNEEGLPPDDEDDDDDESSEFVTAF